MEQRGSVWLARLLRTELVLALKSANSLSNYMKINNYYFTFCILDHRP